MLQKARKLITVTFIELIRWRFNPELPKATMGSFARKVGAVPARFAACCSMVDHPSEKGP
jgi:hypothetical protein